MAGGERDALVLELVRGVIAEVHPHASRQAVTLDSRFDELGIGSLELVELLQRVQNTFGVTLPSELVGRAETPRDLLQAIAASHAPAQEDHGVVSPPSAVAGSPAPATASTLIDALDWHVSATPERTHIRILDESGSPDDMTYAALHREAAAVAAGLLARDVMPGDTVAIMLPTSPAYFSTFAGVLLAGAVPVPLYPPARPSQLSDHLRRHTGILANARAALLVTVPEAVSVGRLLRANVEGLRHVVVPESLTGAMDADLPRPRSVDLALLQYTSGSTGQPKGVALTHANLLANIRAMGQAAAVSGADTFVSWLPLYHDMGLIGAWLSSLYFGMPLVVMAPQVFLTRPSRWLAAIHANHGTISAGPNFGYELCLSKISDAELEGLDLSSWRLAFNGAEPVSPMTIERFTERFAPNGFRRDAMAPVYGLAESSVGLAFPPLGRGPLIDRVDRDTFVRSGRPESATPGQRDALRFVACGQPLPGHEIRIVDATGHELGDRREGRIEFRGPSATAGYFHNPDATRALFHGDWLDTGDLGYIADADLYVTGRVK
ncbi:MAG: AMP-binding protein, partial [Mycobacterium sp.]